MRYRWFVVAVFAILFAGSIFAESSVRAHESYDQEELTFLELINQYRQSKGLPTLVLSDTLAVASKHHSEDMGRYNFFAHNTAKSSYFPAGSTPWNRMKLSGYDYPNSFKAENLAAGYETAEQNFKACVAPPATTATCSTVTRKSSASPASTSPAQNTAGIGQPTSALR